MSLAVVFSPGADSLLLGSLDRTTRLVDLTTGRTRWETPPEDGYAVSAAFSPDGGKVLIGYAMGWLAAMPQTGKAQLFEAATGKPLGPALVHKRPVHAVAFHPGGQSFVTSCGLYADPKEAMETRFWDLDGREIREPLEHVGTAYALAYSLDGTRLLVGLWDRKALLWDLATPREPIVLPHGGPVSSVAFCPDGNTLMTGSYDASVRFWDLGGRLLGAPLRQGHVVDHATLEPRRPEPPGRHRRTRCPALAPRTRWPRGSGRCVRPRGVPPGGQPRRPDDPDARRGTHGHPPRRGYPSARGPALAAPKPRTHRRNHEAGRVSTTRAARIAAGS